MIIDHKKTPPSFGANKYQKHGLYLYLANSPQHVRAVVIAAWFFLSSQEYGRQSLPLWFLSNDIAIHTTIEMLRVSVRYPDNLTRRNPTIVLDFRNRKGIKRKTLGRVECTNSKFGELFFRDQYECDCLPDCRDHKENRFAITTA